jgi:hypothetical protein
MGTSVNVPFLFCNSNLLKGIRMLISRNISLTFGLLSTCMSQIIRINSTRSASSSSPAVSGSCPNAYLKTRDVGVCV